MQIPLSIWPPLSPIWSSYKPSSTSVSIRSEKLILQSRGNDMTTPALQTTLPHMHVGSSRLGAILRVQGIVASMLERLQPLFALAIRFYVSWVFLKSGWLKLSSWDQTLSLFHDEYHVPLLPPDLAAVVGTFGELFFPMLLIVGLAGRIGA